MWRSPVAYWSGGPGVAGSNPVIPTTKKTEDTNNLVVIGFFLVETLLATSVRKPPCVTNLILLFGGISKIGLISYSKDIVSPSC